MMGLAVREYLEWKNKKVDIKMGKEKKLTRRKVLKYAAWAASAASAAVVAGALLSKGSSDKAYIAKNANPAFALVGENTPNPAAIYVNGNGISYAPLSVDNKSITVGDSRLIADLSSANGQPRQIAGTSDGKIVVYGLQTLKQMEVVAADLEKDTNGNISLTNKRTLGYVPQSSMGYGLVGYVDRAWIDRQNITDKGKLIGQHPDRLVYPTAQFDQTGKGYRLDLQGRNLVAVRDPKSSIDGTISEEAIVVRSFGNYNPSRGPENYVFRLDSPVVSPVNLENRVNTNYNVR